LLGRGCPFESEVSSGFGSSNGVKFWLQVMNELKNRGVDDVLLAVVDGLKGLSGGGNSGPPRGNGPDLHLSISTAFMPL
jgi:hypothetical protein